MILLQGGEEIERRREELIGEQGERGKAIKATNLEYFSNFAKYIVELYLNTGSYNILIIRDYYEQHVIVDAYWCKNTEGRSDWTIRIYIHIIYNIYIYTHIS